MFMGALRAPINIFPEGKRRHDQPLRTGILGAKGLS